MKVMVTGATGQLGREVCNCLGELGIQFKGMGRADFDLTEENATRAAILKYAPDAVIHCAAYTAVDKAETEKELCFRVNVLGTSNVAKACRELNARMMYISTDYVFDGQGEMPFETDHAKVPLNHYGLTKAMGEDEIQSRLEKYFIIRISWAFGPHGNNFVKTMLLLGQQQGSVRVVADQIGSPTYTGDLAPLLCTMVQTERYGVYHATNEGFCSWLEFASQIMAQASLPCRVEPVASADYPTTAKRPQNSRLSKRSLDEAGFVRLPAWQDALKRYLLSSAME